MHVYGPSSSRAHCILVRSINNNRLKMLLFNAMGESLNQIVLIVVWVKIQHTRDHEGPQTRINPDNNIDNEFYCIFIEFPNHVLIIMVYLSNSQRHRKRSRLRQLATKW